MNRLGLLHPSELDEQAKALYDSFYTYTTTRYGESAKAGFLTEDGRFMGPFGAQLHTPAVGQHFLGMTKACKQIPGLSDLNREIAIIVVGVRYQAAYELASHRMFGQKYGLSLEEVDTLFEGKKPATFTEDKTAVYDVAHELLYKPGPLSQATWDEAVRLIGKSGAVAIVQYVGFYSYVSTVLNGFDVQLPDVTGIKL
ncbi:hypothetical protein ACEPPN_009108 [Leptodophora sp. 'Broadleaf-Isolate-01']